MYNVFNSSVLITMFTEVGKCSECLDDIHVEHSVSEKKGLDHYF